MDRMGRDRTGQDRTGWGKIRTRIDNQPGMMRDTTKKSSKKGLLGVIEGGVWFMSVAVSLHLSEGSKLCGRHARSSAVPKPKCGRVCVLTIERVPHGFTMLYIVGAQGTRYQKKKTTGT